MRKNTYKRPGLDILAFLIAVVFYSHGSWASTEVTIIGEVNDTYQIVADNVIYEVYDNKLGNDLVFNYIAARVKVTGLLTEKGGMKFITVTSFEVLPD